jgi:hypothetical protein
MTDPAAPQDLPPDQPSQLGGELDDRVFRSIAEDLTIPGQPDRSLELAMTDWLDTMVRELGEKWIGGPWDPREDIPRHTMGDLDALQNDYCLRLVSKLRAWADPLEP